MPFLEPPNMTTCWMALDETAADTGTIYYARGSHAWGQLPTGGHVPRARGLARLDARGRPPDVEAEMVPIEVPPAARPSTTASFHGSPPNERARRGPARDHQPHGLDGHDLASDARHPLYSRYMRPGELEMDEVYFPIMWREDDYRTPYIESHFAAAA